MEKAGDRKSSGKREFLQTTCAITGMLMGVDPFDQPGVEDYKREMRKALGQL